MGGEGAGRDSRRTEREQRAQPAIWRWSAQGLVDGYEDKILVEEIDAPARAGTAEESQRSLAESNAKAAPPSIPLRCNTARR